MKRSVLVAALVCTGTCLSAAAQFRKAEDAIKHRQSAMALQGHYVGQIFAMANGRVPFDAKVAAENAEILSTLTRLAWVGFAEGTDKGETAAKPEIWKDRGRFDETVRKLQDDVAKLNAAAKTGSQDQIKAAVGTVGQTCKSCHDTFKRE
jgi:cytochrome c556